MFTLILTSRLHWLVKVTLSVMTAAALVFACFEWLYPYIQGKYFGVTL